MATDTENTCRDCEEVKPELENGLCEDCSENYTYCCICNNDQHKDDTCRHLYWDNTIGWWHGAGSDYIDWEAVAENMGLLLSDAGVPFARLLLGWLCRDELHLFWRCDCLGGGGSVENRVRGAAFRVDILSIFEADIQRYGNAHEMEQADALWWLASLSPQVTTERFRTAHIVSAWIQTQVVQSAIRNPQSAMSDQGER